MGNRTSSNNKGSNNTMASEKLIKSEIASHKVVIFGKTYCPYCRAVKNLFANVPDTKSIELDQRNDGADIQNALYRMTGQRTVPNVFVNGKHLGGNDDAQMAQRTGQLQQMLAV